MKRDTASGLALIFGSICLLVTMALHPTGGSVERIVRLAGIARGTHSLALASMPLMFLGFLGLYHRLKADELFAPAALVTVAFGHIAAMCAAVLNGLAAPAYAERYASDPTAQDTLRAVLTYNYLLNSGFAKVFMVATAAATIFWSLAILRTGALARWTAWLGCLLGAVGLFSVLGGFLGTSVHAFGLFIVGSSVWTVAVGVLLCRSPAVVRVA